MAKIIYSFDPVTIWGVRQTSDPVHPP